MAKRRKSAEPSGYQGLLAEPVRQLSLLELGDPDSRQKYAADRLKKVDLLFEHYGIDRAADNSGLALALALAARHVPGFKPAENRPGRPREDKDRDNTLV